LLLIRRLLHPSTPDFDPIRGRFFAQVLPKFSASALSPFHLIYLVARGCVAMEKTARLKEGFIQRHFGENVSTMPTTAIAFSRIVGSTVAVFHDDRAC